MKINRYCDVDRCKLKATFVSLDREVLACTRHARQGFTLHPTVIALALGAKATYYREGLGNLEPLTAVR